MSVGKVDMLPGMAPVPHDLLCEIDAALMRGRASPQTRKTQDRLIRLIRAYYPSGTRAAAKGQMNGLAACPFCGGAAVIMVGHHANSDAKVGCADCRAEGELFGVSDWTGKDWTPKAIAAWNRRTPDAAKAARIKQLEYANEQLVGIANKHKEQAEALVAERDEYRAALAKVQP